MSVRICLTTGIFTALPTLAIASRGSLEWRSPVQPTYAELHNESFISELGLHQHLDAFRAFWPFAGKGTPNWDAAAVVPCGTGQGVVLVEAKAHLAEFDKPKDAAGAKDETSVRMISDALAAARRFYGVAEEAPDWRTSYYQVCNRLTHLWWMSAKADVPTWIVWVFIVDDPYWRAEDRFSGQMAQTSFAEVLARVGMPVRHPLQDRIGVVCLPPSPTT